MKKVNKVIYNKLLAQAEEAKETGMTKLASNILEAIGSYPEDEVQEYSSDELESDINKDLWKTATNLIKYYEVESVDVEKLNAVLESFAEKLVDELKTTLDIENDLGPNEPKVFGE